MLLMQSHLNETNTIRERFGLEANQTWANISDLITIPVGEEANIILEYASQNGSITVKQADIVLIDDFLQWPNPYTLSNLDYYAAAQSPDGPAMTYGVFSVVANRESPSGCSSYTYDLYGSQPYTRGPWYQFSEQLIDDWSTNGGTHPAFPFLTGVGGAHRVAVFGYLGLRLMLDTLNIDPSLPPQIPQLAFRTIYWQGWPIKAFSNQTHTTLTRPHHRRGGNPLSTANSTFATAPIPVTISISGTTIHHNLHPNSSLTLSNRQIGLIPTFPGNIAQCRPVVSSPQLFLPGQFPLSAIDGAVSTKWQPVVANVTASITISLPEPFLPIVAIRFDWAKAPPRGYSVTFSNFSSSSSPSNLPSGGQEGQGEEKVVNVTSSSHVQISHPYNSSSADLIRPYASNVTNVTLERPVWSGKFATLEIWGSWANDDGDDGDGDGDGNGGGVGASVAEFAIIAQGSGENVVARSGRGEWLS